MVAFGGALLGMLLEYWLPDAAIGFVQAFEYSLGLTGGVGLTKDLARKIGGQ
jgi:hypothetical protein